jgi:hypothetical protein
MRAPPFLLGLALLLVFTAYRGPARADDAPPPPPLPGPLEAVFLPLKERLQASTLPPFIKDTDLKVNFRSYYFNRINPNDTQNEAWAFGGWVGYRSGWLLDTFAMGATLYGSASLYAPEDHDGTLLLKPGQEGYYVPGEAWGALRYQDYALLKGYRQKVDQTYINPQDNRMTPNTFQGVTLGGKVSWVQYLGGFLWEIKPRNADEFISMSQKAGARGESDDGVGLFGVRLTPLDGLRIDVSNQYGVNTFNTFYAEADYLRPLTGDWKLRVGVQFTDQRAVGDALLPAAGGQFNWATQAGGARVQAIYRDLTLTGAFSITGAGNTIQTPWGLLSGLPLDDRPGLRPRRREGRAGRCRVRFQGARRGPEREFQSRVGLGRHQPIHGPEGAQPGGIRCHRRLSPGLQRPFFLKGLWFRARAAILDQQDAKTLGYQFRLIANWERDFI